MASVAKHIHEPALKMMKSLLDLGEFAFSSIGGRDSGAFRHYKNQVMFEVADMERDLFRRLESRGLVEPCDCGSTLDSGPRWHRCPHCAGCGYREVVIKEAPDESGPVDS